MADPVLIHAGNAQAAGRKYGVDPADILGILSVEGGTSATGQPVAPHDGAGPPSFGQFTYGTGAALGIKFGDSKSETDGIARYLVQLGYHDNRQLAIARYNGGPGNPQFTYASKVLAAAKRYTGLGSSSSSTAPASEPASTQDDSSGLFGTTQRSGAVRALVYVALTLAGATLAGLGLTRTTGLRGGTT